MSRARKVLGSRGGGGCNIGPEARARLQRLVKMMASKMEQDT